MEKTIVYKLTDSFWETYNRTQWGEGVTNKASGKGDLCGSGFIHCYSHPLVAVLMNPIHAKFKSPVLWKAEGYGIMKNDCGLKLGFSKLTTLKRIEIPEVTPQQKVAFGILCALGVETSEYFVSWAKNWLHGIDRTRNSACEVQRETFSGLTNSGEAAAIAAKWLDQDVWLADVARMAAMAAEFSCNRAKSVNQHTDFTHLAKIAMVLLK